MPSKSTVPPLAASIDSHINIASALSEEILDEMEAGELRIGNMCAFINMLESLAPATCRGVLKRADLKRLIGALQAWPAPEVLNLHFQRMPVHKYNVYPEWLKRFKF